MFSANENIQLRKQKQQVVQMVEECIPEDALDMGTMVMAMQVSCKAPGCVPLETAIIIVFPKIDQELIPGLPESRGGNYKTKVLKPMVEVTKEDILDALPPEFPGGKRSMERLCMQARDVMLGQITQLFADDDVPGRRLMAEYLKEYLQEYTDRDCVPPEWGEPFPSATKKNNGKEPEQPTTNGDAAAEPSGEKFSAKETAAKVTASGNFVFKRPKDEEESNASVDRTFVPSARPITSGTTYKSSPPERSTEEPNKPKVSTKDIKYSNSATIMGQLGERLHAPGIRRPRCPCCDPDNADNMIDSMMAL